MLDKATLIPSLMERLQKMPVGNCIDIRTYKRNRSLLFVRQTDTAFRVFQDGFEKQEHQVEMSKMPKFLKTMLRREFPRSRKVRLYDLGVYDPKTSHTLDWKKL